MSIAPARVDNVRSVSPRSSLPRVEDVDELELEEEEAFENDEEEDEEEEEE